MKWDIVYILVFLLEEPGAAQINFLVAFPISVDFFEVVEDFKGETKLVGFIAY